jgi:hypothetical protein
MAAGGDDNTFIGEDAGRIIPADGNTFLGFRQSMLIQLGCVALLVLARVVI